jgi:hypothetical protein
MKSKIILQANEFSSFVSWYLESLWQEYFDIKIYDPNLTYSQHDLFVFWHLTQHIELADRLLDQGHKVVIDNLWEVPNGQFDKYYQLCNPNWFWWNESLWWRSLGHDQYRPKKTYEKLALMPIRRPSPIRDQIVEKLGPLKDDMIWSYQQQRLPNDRYLSDNTDVEQRFMNPQWYDSTCINLVVETVQQGEIYRMTEKTYKSCAFYQPMLIVGQSNSLKLLKQQGFETFENLFDESYDQELVFDRRFDLVLDNLKSFVKESYSLDTWKKLDHNHNHFFNESLCRQGIIQEIIEPLLHYAET